MNINMVRKHLALRRLRRQRLVQRELERKRSTRVSFSLGTGGESPLRHVRRRRQLLKRLSIIRNVKMMLT